MNPEPDALDNMIERAEQLFFDGDYEQSCSVFREALELAEEGEKDWRYASLLNTYSGALRMLGQNEEAMQASLQALPVVEALAEPGNVDYASILNNLGQMSLNIGKMDEAREYYEKALKVLHGGDQPDQSALAMTYGWLADLEEYEENEDRALEMLITALEHARSSGVPQMAAEFALRSSDALEDQDRLEESVEMLQVVKDELIEHLKEGKDPKAIMDPEAMAFEMIKQEFQEEKREPSNLLLLRLQLARQQYELDPEAEDMVSTMAEMGTFEGRIYGEDSSQLGEQYHQVATALHLLAEATGKPEHYRKAESYYRTALGILRKNFEEDSPELKQVTDNLAELRRSLPA